MTMVEGRYPLVAVSLETLPFKERIGQKNVAGYQPELISKAEFWKAEQAMVQTAQKTLEVLYKNRVWNLIIIWTCLVLFPLCFISLWVYLVKNKPNDQEIKKKETELARWNSLTPEQREKALLPNLYERYMGQIAADIPRATIYINGEVLGRLCGKNLEFGDGAIKQQIEDKLGQVVKPFFKQDERKVVEFMSLFHQGLFANVTGEILRFLLSVEGSSQASAHKVEVNPAFQAIGSSGEPAEIQKTPQLYEQLRSQQFVPEANASIQISLSQDGKVQAFCLFDIHKYDGKVHSRVQDIAIRVFIELDLNKPGFAGKKEWEIIHMPENEKEQIREVPVWEIPADSSTWGTFLAARQVRQ